MEMSGDEDEESRTPVEETQEADLAIGAQTILTALERLKGSAYLPQAGGVAFSANDVYEDYEIEGEEGEDRAEDDTARREAEGDLLTSMCSFNGSHFADQDSSVHPSAQNAPLFDKSTHSTMTIRTRNKTKTLPLEKGTLLGAEVQKANDEPSPQTNGERTVAELLAVVAAYDRFAQLTVQAHRAARENERRVLTAHRDAALNDVVTLQRSASELHSRFENGRTLLERARAIETAWQSKVPALVSKYSALKRTAEEQLNKAYREADAFRSRSETELTELRSRLRRVEMERDSLREECARRANETAELHAICDELVAKLNESAS